MFDAVTYAAAVAAARNQLGYAPEYTTREGRNNYLSPAAVKEMVQYGERFKMQTFVSLGGMMLPVLLDSGLFVYSPADDGLAASTIVFYNGFAILAQLAGTDQTWEVYTKMLSTTDIPG